MTRFVGLLRGINVGGRNTVAMADLREVAEGLGWDEVSTHLNSGNLLFTATGTAATHTKALADAVHRKFGRSIDVVVRSRDELAKALDANPYPDGDPKQVHLTFLAGRPPAGASDRLAALARESEPFTISGTTVYVDYGGGLADSKLAAGFAKAVGVSATARNLRTCTTLLEKLG